MSIGPRPPKSPFIRMTRKTVLRGPFPRVQRGRLCTGSKEIQNNSVNEPIKGGNNLLNRQNDPIKGGDNSTSRLLVVNQLSTPTQPVKMLIMEASQEPQSVLHFLERKNKNPLHFFKGINRILLHFFKRII